MAWDFFLGKMCWSSGSAGVGQEMVRECPPRLGLFVLGGLVPFPDGSSELSLLLRSQVQETSLSSKCE